MKTKEKIEKSGGLVTKDFVLDNYGDTAQIVNVYFPKDKPTPSIDWEKLINLKEYDWMFGDLD